MFILPVEKQDPSRGWSCGWKRFLLLVDWLVPLINTPWGTEISGTKIQNKAYNPKHMLVISAPRVPNQEVQEFKSSLSWTVKLRSAGIPETLFPKTKINNKCINTLSLPWVVLLRCLARVIRRIARKVESCCWCRRDLTIGSSLCYWSEEGMWKRVGFQVSKVEDAVNEA